MTARRTSTSSEVSSFPRSSSAVVAGGAVDELAQDVEMPGVASCLLDHVDEDPP